MNENIIKKRITNYLFFDGINRFNVIEIYDNWLSLSDYDIYKNSYVEIDCVKFYLFQNESQPLTTFNNIFNLINLEFISIQFEMILKNKSNLSYCVSKNHEFDNFYILNLSFSFSHYIILYGIGGSKFPESFTIHGVWEVNHPLLFAS